MSSQLYKFQAIFHLSEIIYEISGRYAPINVLPHYPPPRAYMGL